MEKEVEATPYAIIQLCDVCETGELLPTGNNKYMPVVKIEHKCSFCGELRYFKETYPAIRFLINREVPL